MNKLIAQLSDLEWSKVIMLGLALAGAYYVLIFDSGESISGKITQQQQQLVEANTKLSQTMKAMQDANRFELEVKRIAQQFDQITNFMPMTIGPAELTQIVNQSAGLAGVRVSKIEPKGPDTRAGFYEASRVFVSISGNFAQILEFLEMLSRVPKLLTFDEVEVRSLKAPGAPPTEISPLAFEGLLVGYRYIKDAPYEEPKKAGPGVPGVPGVPGGGR
ncbi:MAG: type 4a pilus biogenesis protein PilO [Bdellovibrionota bacterium]